MIIGKPSPDRSTKYSRNLKHLQKIECAICKSKEQLEIHRIQPREFGGKYTYDNIEVVCALCHRTIHYLIDCEKFKSQPQYVWKEFLTATANLIEERKKWHNQEE